MNASVRRKLVESGWAGAAAVAGGLLLATVVGHTIVSAQGHASTLLTVDYRETKWLKDASRTPVIVEEGTYVIDPQGRYRVERRRGTSHTVEIVDHRLHTRSALDLDKKRAVTGAITTVVPGITSLPGGAPVVVESEAAPQGQRGQPLGTRTLANGLVVEGVRFEFHIAQSTGPVTLTMEQWYYRFGDRSNSPVMIEQRFEDATSITTRDVLSVSRWRMDESLFLVPAGFNVVKRPSDADAHK